ncbi:MAG: membrane lipoprotein lipid attachment site-containing protein [Oscillospiraceae bacterium]|nr:membrane lipoprotein lipid attachment site-containing protein [Oscillospiraceae bacterium]
MKKIFCVLLALLMLSSCGWEVSLRNPKEEQQDSESSSSLAELIEEDPVDEEFIEIPIKTPDMESLDSTGLLRFKAHYYNPFESMEPDDSAKVEWGKNYPRIYIYDSLQCKYEVFEYRIEEVSATLNQLVAATIDRMNYNRPQAESFKISVSYQKSMAVVDFYDTTEDFWSYMDFDKRCEQMLGSIAMTLMESAGFENVGFTAEGGGQFKTKCIELEADGFGKYVPQELYAEVSGEEFASLRALCEYDESWAEELPSCYSHGPNLTAVYDESVTLRPKGLDIVIANAGYTGEFRSPDEIPDSVMIQACFDTPLFVDTQSTDSENYIPGLEAIEKEINDFIFIPKEWVEEVAKRLFGPEAEVEHQSLGIWTYYAEAGVYTPKHIGGWADEFPYVFSVEETEDGYIAEAAYIDNGMGGYGFCGSGIWIGDYTDWEKPLQYDEKAMDFIKNEAPRFLVTFKYNEEGELYMASSEKIPTQMTEEQREIAAKYIAPIHYLAVNEKWVNPNDISGKGYYFTFYSMEHGMLFVIDREYEHYGIDKPEKAPYERAQAIPTEIFEGALKKHFESELPSLRNEYYDSENDCYYYPEYIGFGNDYYPVVTWAGDTGYGYYSILFDIQDYSGNVVASKELQIDISDPENWKYKYCG